MKILIQARKDTKAESVGTDMEHWYVRDKLEKVSMMLDDADQKFAEAQKLYNKTSDSEPHPESDYAEGASAAMGYARKQVDFIDDRIDDYLDDYNLKQL